MLRWVGFKRLDRLILTIQGIENKGKFLKKKQVGREECGVRIANLIWFLVFVDDNLRT